MTSSLLSGKWNHSKMGTALKEKNLLLEEQIIFIRSWPWQLGLILKENICFLKIASKGAKFLPRGVNYFY